MSIWTFKPIIDGEPAKSAEGTDVVIDVEVPSEAKDVTLETFIDGEQVKNKYLLPDSVYDVLKWVGLLLLPTLAWMYSMLAGAWELPYAEQIPFTLNVCGTVIAVLIGASTLNNIRKGA